MTLAARPHLPELRHPPALPELFLAGFRRDLLAFFPRATFEPVDADSAPEVRGGPPNFRLVEAADGTALVVELFGTRLQIKDRDGATFTPQERRMVRALGAVLTMRYHHLYQITSSLRVELYRGGAEDHNVAAFLEPGAYDPASSRPSRIAATIQALRIAALSTYENHRVSTGALLLGPLDDPSHAAVPTPLDAVAYGVELTGLKSVHRLCDGQRTLFLIDRAGRLAEIIDVARWASEIPPAATAEPPCARAYQAHVRATRVGGHVCLVLSPNQEIKVFASGAQVFAFAHGHWRILDPAARYRAWETAVAHPALARALFQAALDLAEMRQGGLFVVVADPVLAFGTLIAPDDMLSLASTSGPPPDLSPRDPLAKRALHYLARGRNATTLDPPILEALASLDGALVTDRAGRLLAFGAILRHDISDLPAFTTAEGARTTAAYAASRFGPVLKVSEDGVVSCYIDGARAWDL
jgi:hypothetical protein